MTRIVCSRRPEVVWQSRPSWQHPSRRQHIHGPIQPLYSPSRIDWISNAVIVGMAVGLAVLCSKFGWSW